MGCPTTYNGYTATWTRGKLAKLTKGNKIAGSNTYQYGYNALGQRISRSYAFTQGTGSSSAVAMGTLTNYNKTFRYDQSGRLICESIVSKYYGEGDKLEKNVYLYDETGIVGMVYTSNNITNSYYFRRNLLGDVIGIYDTSGAKVAGYAYDAWGNCTITSDTTKYDVAHANPIRYRGYYYDEDTKLYYLNARYYCPEWRGFISPDNTGYLDPETPNGLNLYCYCNNDPVNYADPSGCNSASIWKTILGVGIGIGLAAVAITATILTGGSFAAIGVGFALGATASFVGQGVGNVLSGENFFDGMSIGSIIMGGLAGAAFATGFGGFWGAVAIGAASNAGTSALENKSWANIAGSAIVGGIAAGIGYGVGRFVTSYVYRTSGMSFNDFYGLGRIDTNPVKAAYHAFRASWNTFLPNISTSASRGLIKFLGNKGIGWF